MENFKKAGILKHTPTTASDSSGVESVKGIVVFYKGAELMLIIK